MNIPETEANQAQFLALERRKKRIRETNIREFENKKLCSGQHILSYGSYQEHQEEIKQQEIVATTGTEQIEPKREEKQDQESVVLLENQTNKKPIRNNHG